MKKHLNTQVAVIGAGPAGLACSMFLAQQGTEFICIDSKKSPGQSKVNCGYSWSDFIKKYNFSGKVWLQHYDQFFLHLPGTRVEASLPKFVKEGAGYISREQLYKEMYERAKGVGLFLFDEKVEDSRGGLGGLIENIETEGHKISARIFVDCSGFSGVLAHRYIGKSTKEFAEGLEYIFERRMPELSNLPNVLEMFIGVPFEGGYGWVAPMGDKINIGVGKFENEIAEKPLNLILEELLGGKYFNKKTVGNLISKEAGMLPTRLLRKFNYKNFVCVGDSAGQVNPIAGEGVRFIVEFAELVADSILKALNTGKIEESLESYTRNWYKNYGTMYRLGIKTSKLFRKLRFNKKVEKNLLLNIARSNSSKELPQFFKGELTYEAVIKLLGKGILCTLLGRKLWDTDIEIRIVNLDSGNQID